ncbi:DUF4149 domain-containing protein [Rhodothermus marinus]|uniref:Copper resistance D n=1 Tax=Rhodothermus marinus (strain ATCC 43812 / DSM 4252 / R-10) TaxID=518766 RepID=D0MED9_RHOM4|nr:DUF4149 domain-containing protein [Rhodothermus marinus]ACY49167.1 copper resistance D [Rhodothermus marinus DSM 4252]
MSGWYLFSVWLHILAATVWIGSMIFLGVAVVPLLRRPEFAPVRTAMLYQLGLRFRWIGWTVLLLLVITGIVNIGYRGYGWDDLFSGALWQGPWGRTLAWKLVLVLLVMGISAVHDFYLGPRTMQLLERGEASAEHLRRVASYLGRLMTLLSLAILALAVLLVRGGM